MREPRVNDVIEINGNAVRVLAINRTAGLIWLFPLEGNNPLPREWAIEDFQLDSVQSTLRYLPEPAEERPWETSPADIQVSTDRWNRIKDLVSSPQYQLLLQRTTRASCLAEHAKNVGTSDRTLLADLRLWWAGGQKRSALLGRYFQSGRVSGEKGQRTFSLEVTDDLSGLKSTVFFAPQTQLARGRRPVHEDYVPFSIPFELRKTMLKTAQDYFLADNTRSMRATADYVLRKHFALRDEKGAMLRGPDGRSAVLPPPGQRPTVAQIRYLLQKVLTVAQQFRSRFTEAEFKNNHADASGSVSEDTAGPGDVYEIDATIVDLFVVAHADRATIIGKPTLYLVIDRKTRLIVGFYISLENASWNEAKLAIMSIAGDWEALCRRLGVPYKASDWPAAGVLPNRFVGDRGEMLSYASDVICEELAIPITNPPALAARRKCIVEGGFHTTQVPLRDNVPGYEPQSNVTKRRGKKYDRDASLTLDELAAIYLHVVIAHNNKVMTNYPLTPQEVLRGDRASPVNLWQKGIQSSMGSLPRYQYSTLQRALMNVEEALVTQYGVRFRECVYTFRHPAFKDWVSRASIRGSFRVRVAFSPGLVDEIIVLDPSDGRKQYIGELAPASQHFTGYSYAEVKAITKEKARLDRQGQHGNTASNVGLSEDIEAVSNPARARTKQAAKGLRLGARHAGAKDARAAESRKRRASANTSGGHPAYSIAALQVPVVSAVSATNTSTQPVRTGDPNGARDVDRGVSSALLNLIDG